MKLKIFWRNLLFLSILLVLLTACSDKEMDVKKEDLLQIEIVHVGHPHVEASMVELNKIFEEYQDQIQVHSYTFQSDEGERLVEQHGIEGHTPLLLFIDGEMEHEIDGKKVKFYSLPQGANSPMDGGWTYDDVKTVITERIGRQ